MNLINIEHISKIYGEKVIFDDASFGVQQGDKIGIVGINGTGKSTLLKVVAGEEIPDEGQVVRQNGLKIAFVPQNPTFPEGMDIRSYALQDADAESWQVESNLTELGITQWDQKIETLSGGQKRRVVLAKILAGDFDVLLLDEPTNHLDQEMISWLEDYLRSYRGTVLMVTHDRYFLDRVTNRILELSHGKMYGYDADYSGFLELKAQREEMELASQRKRQSILRMELEWAKRGCRARTTKQKARLERLEALKAGKQIDEAAVSQNKNDANALVTIKKKIRKKKWIAISITAVCLLAAVVFIHYFPIYRIIEVGGTSYFSSSETAKLAYIAQKHNPYSGKRMQRFAIADIPAQKTKNCMACFQDMQPILTIGMMYPLSITLLNFGLHTLMTQRDTFGCIIPMR